MVDTLDVLLRHPSGRFLTELVLPKAITDENLTILVR